MGAMKRRAAGGEPHNNNSASTASSSHLASHHPAPSYNQQLSTKSWNVIVAAFVLGGCLCAISLFSALGNGRRANEPAAPSFDFSFAKPALLDAALDALGCDTRADEMAIKSCVERIAEDNSKKERARRYHLEENARAARSRAAEPSEYGSFRRSNVPMESTTHPNLVGMDGRFDAKDEWNNDNINDGNNGTGVAYPNIEIVGFPKAGTSHLYSILLDRPDTVEFHPSNKEFCSGTMHQGKSNETIQQALFEWTRECVSGKPWEDSDLRHERSKQQ